MNYVHPREVEVLRERLAPAFEAVGREPRGAELVARWRSYCAQPCGWLDAVELLEHGRDLEAELALVQGPRMPVDHDQKMARIMSIVCPRCRSSRMSPVERADGWHHPSCPVVLPYRHPIGRPSQYAPASWGGGVPEDLRATPPVTGYYGGNPRRPRGTPVIVGSVLGDPSVAELEDLCAAQAAQLEQLDQARGCPAWAAADPAGYGQWAADVYDASEKLRSAIALAHTLAIDLIPESIRPFSSAGIHWRNVLDAAHPLVDLVRRYIVAGYCPWQGGALPQPRKLSDADMRAFLWADTKTKQIEETAAAAVDTGETVAKWVGVGVLAAAGLLILGRAGR